ncbi:MAG: hypothetical protein L0191_06025 [Acidobacteria bacterium]|nr:hypothetical protein [Acidobacteriota bacterium]
MESNERLAKVFRFTDPRQERIHRRLLLVSPGPASFYRDACQLMAPGAPLDSTTHLVAHLLREIESALRDVLEPVVQRSARLTKENVSAEAGHRAEIQTVLKGLEIPETDPVAQAWLRLAGKKNAHGLYARAHRDALAPPRPIDQEFREFWAEVEAILDVVLDRFESRYLASHRLLDELLAKTSPTRSDAQTLRNRVPNNLVALGYFFDKLTSAAWLEPLRAEGFFRHPPEPDRDQERGTIRFPLWPDSRYLARMAAVAPETVLEVALQIPDTENVRVHQDLADAALAMPADLAPKLVPKAKAWMESPYQLLLPEKLGRLVGHLARGGQAEAALDLARSLLAVLPEAGAREAGAGESYPVAPEARARFEPWYYEQILRKNIPDLVLAVPGEALSVLCDLLDSTIRLSRRDQAHDGPEDYSYIWRPAIEDHEQNHPHRVRDFLVSAVRDAAEQIARADPRKVPALVERLEGRRPPWHVFQRITLHLLRIFPDAAPALVAEHLTDPRRFDETGLWHEYALLARDRFRHLSPPDQAKILGWIEEGPDREKFMERAEEELTGRRSTQEDFERFANAWRLKRLARLRDSLPLEWRGRYEELVSQLGEPEHPEFASYTSSWVGPTSPKSAQDLSSMSVEQVVAFLRSWQPSGEDMSPSPEGLGRQLTPLVASDPARFAAEVARFQGLDPTYVRAFLSGLRDAVRQSRAFSWPQVLRLCRWVVDQLREIPGRKSEYRDLDPGWVWTRKTIGDLLSAGFADGPAETPFDLRASAWAVLQPITDDPDPAPADEERHGGPNMDPAALSINTTRGEAMHAVMAYALWVRRHIEKESDGNERVARGFDEMPEVRDVLEAHLDPARDSSLAIRSVYGRWFPWLVLLDSGWATSSVRKIFPTEEGLENLRDAAWETYIIFCAPYDNVFDVLREEYGRAVERIDAPRPERRQSADPREGLSEHLMTFYWRGKLDLGGPGGLIARFFVKAPGALRRHAVEFVGQSLRSTEGAVAPEILARLQALWLWRTDAARGATPTTSHSTELGAFGWWFASGKFDDSWSTTQLTEVLRVASKADPDHLVVERLATLAPAMPMAAVECLSLMIEGEKEGWGIHSWREHMRSIVTAAIQSTDDSAREAAVALVHRLGALGHLDFQDLISEKG